MAQGKSGSGPKDVADGNGRTVTPSDSFAQVLRVGPDFVLADVDPRATPGFDGDRDEGAQVLREGAQQLSGLQERFYAQARGGSNAALLLVVQGMDTAGKGGIMRHVVGSVDPQGVTIAAFKAPTAQERAHDFLWRIRAKVPHPGQIGVFDRSHYEDVLIVRVHDLVPPAVWEQRYDIINDFERELTESGTTVVKVMLHISAKEQAQRLMERLDRPEKYWKFNPGDIDERAHWTEYQQAYQAALTRCATPNAPWYCVPADRKWYARLAVQQILLDHLTALDPQWPPADFDVAEQRARLRATMTG